MCMFAVSLASSISELIILINLVIIPTNRFFVSYSPLGTPVTHVLGPFEFVSQA